MFPFPSHPPSLSPVKVEEDSEVSHSRPLRVLFQAELRAWRRFPGRSLEVEGRSEKLTWDSQSVAVVPVGGEVVQEEWVLQCERADKC